MQNNQKLQPLLLSLSPPTSPAHLRIPPLCASAQLDDGDVGGGGGPVYIMPEGPTTHYGHAITDSVIPMFVTVQLRESNEAAETGETIVARGPGGDESPSSGGRSRGERLVGWGLRRTRRQVLLWPMSSNQCPVKGRTVHSRQFWDLFSVVTTHPREDVLLLSEFLLGMQGAAKCYAEVVLGQLIDQRVGYWMGPGLLFTPRAVPFIEDLPTAVRSLSFGLLFSSKTVLTSLHPSFSDLALDQPHLTLIDRTNRRILNAAQLLDTAAVLGFRTSQVDWLHLPVRDQVCVCFWPFHVHRLAACPCLLATMTLQDDRRTDLMPMLTSVCPLTRVPVSIGDVGPKHGCSGGNLRRRPDQDGLCQARLGHCRGSRRRGEVVRSGHDVLTSACALRCRVQHLAIRD